VVGTGTALFSGCLVLYVHGQGCAPPEGLEGSGWPLASGLALEAALELAGVAAFVFREHPRGDEIMEH